MAQPIPQSDIPDFDNSQAYGAAQPIDPSDLPDGVAGAAPPKTNNAATGYNSPQDSHLQVWNPKTLWDPSASNFDTGIGIGSGSQNFLAGAGKSFEDTGQGVHQIALHIGQHLGLVSKDDVAKVDADAKQRRIDDEDLMGTTAGSLGNMAGNVAQTALIPGGGGIGAQMLKQGLGQAALGAVQPEDNPGMSNVVNAGEQGLGGAVGAGLGGVAGKIIQPFAKQTPRAEKALDILNSEGVHLDASQVTGSSFLGGMRRVAADAPLFGSPESAEKTASTFTQAALQHAGLTGDSISPEMLQDAYESLGQTRSAIYRNNPINAYKGLNGGYFNSFNDDLDTIVKGARMSGIKAGEATDDPISIINHLKRPDVTNSATGIVDPDALNDMRGATSDLSKSANYRIRKWGGDMQDPNGTNIDLASVMDRRLMDQESVPGDGLRLQQVNQQLSYLHKIDKATRGGTIPYVPPGALSRSMVKVDALDPMKQLADAGAQIIPDKVGNSGTATRLLGTMGATAGLGAAAGAAHAIYSGEDIGGAAKEAGEFALFGAAAPKVAGMLTGPRATRLFSAWQKGATPRALSNIAPTVGAGVGGSLANRSNLFGINTSSNGEQ